jgi:hypothetical protein
MPPTSFEFALLDLDADASTYVTDEGQKDRCGLSAVT